jgi:uncharacterized DUF497 family protein
MEFEFNPTKSMGNQVKHGINFRDAQRLWEDPRLQIIKARVSDEPRWIAIGRIGDRYWSSVFTTRGDAIRIISVRRSRPKEIASYEN